jgi:hypothetical protein
MKYYRLIAAICHRFAAICLCLGLGLSVGLYSFPAAAAYMTGDDLVKKCESNDGRDVYACMSYVAGVIDYQIMQQSMGTEPSVDFCLPEDLTIEKAAVTVMLYLEKNPQQGSFIAAPAVSMALQQAYPCAPVKARRKHKHGG